MSEINNTGSRLKNYVAKLKFYLLKNKSYFMYFFVFITIIILSVESKYTINKIYNEHEKYATIINISGRQRMLSVRITMYIYYLKTTNNKDNSMIIKNLLNDINTVRITNEELKIKSKNSTAHNEVLYNRIKNFTSMAKQAVEEKNYNIFLDEFNPTNIKFHIDEINKNVEDFVSNSVNDINKILDFSRYILFSTIIILLIEGFFIFRPMSRDLSEKIEELNNKNILLAKQNKAVQEASRLKSEFLTNMSNELRIPLNGIIEFSDLVYSEKVGPVSQPQKDYLANILSNGKNILQVISNILNISKIESGELKFYPESISVKKLIMESCELVKFLLEFNKIEIETEIPNNIGDFFIDANKFKQIVYNYLTNAIKFNRKGNKIIIRIILLEDEKFCLEVEDNGIGIKAENIDKLFKEFQQLDSSVGKFYQGTGLGLALTRKIVEAQGGTVGVRSEFGKGSTFFAILPRESKLVNLP